jgi:hypothetical protein
MPTGAEDVWSWGQTGNDRSTLKTALLTDSVEKVLLAGERKFLGPLMRFARCDVRDHIDSRKNDCGPS